MKRNIITGIDVGTYHIKVMIAERVPGRESHLPRVLGTGIAESKGVRHGYIADQAEAQKSIATAVKQAEKVAKVTVKDSFISAGGIGLSSVTASGKTAISRADMEVSEVDIKAAHDVAENEIPPSLSLNRKVVHSIPVEYKLDGQTVFGNPVGMKGSTLEATMLFITCLEPHLTELMDTVESLDIDVVDVIAAPVAASFVTLNKTQKTAGCVLTNIGAETTSIIIFENNIPVSLEVFPIGGSDITNDIALGFKIPIDEAEQIKQGGVTPTDFPTKELSKIVHSRISKIFGNINDHLKKINRQELLPAGAILAGGSAQTRDIESVARSTLKLPVTTAALTVRSSKIEKMRDSSWATAYGLCVIGVSEQSEQSSGSSGKWLGKAVRTVMNWIKQFLP